MPRDLSKEEISAYMANVAKQRKNPYHGFKDKEKARAAAKKRWEKHVPAKEKLLPGSQAGEK